MAAGGWKKKLTSYKAVQKFAGYGRGVRLDVLCTMSDGSERNVEVQRSNYDDHLRRLWYNGAEGLL